MRSQLVGNQSGDEEEFDPDGTPKLIKIEQIEQVTDDSEAEGNSPDPDPKHSPAKNQENQDGQETAQGPQQGSAGAMDTIDLAEGGSEFSEEDEEDLPPKEQIDAARQQVTFQLVQEIMANPNTATAMVQILKKLNFEIPLDDNTSARCGVDFLNIRVPKEARIRRAHR